MWNVPLRLFTGTFSPDLRQQRIARGFWVFLIGFGLYCYLFSEVTHSLGEQHLYRLLAVWVLAPVMMLAGASWRWWKKTVRPQLERLEQIAPVEEAGVDPETEDWAED